MLRCWVWAQNYSECLMIQNVIYSSRNRKSQHFRSTKAKSFSMIRNKLLPSASVTRFVYDVNSNLINFPSQIVLQFAFCLSKTIHLDSDMLPDADTLCHIIMLQILNLKCKQCLQPCLAWVSEHHYRSNYERSTNSTSKLDWLPILVLFQTIYQQLQQNLKSFSSIRRTFGRWSNLNFSFSHRKK